MSSPLLQVDDLCKSFQTGDGRIDVLQGVFQRADRLVGPTRLGLEVREHQGGRGEAGLELERALQRRRGPVERTRLGVRGIQRQQGLGPGPGHHPAGRVLHRWDGVDEFR